MWLNSVALIYVDTNLFTFHLTRKKNLSSSQIDTTKRKVVTFCKLSTEQVHLFLFFHLLTLSFLTLQCILSQLPLLCKTLKHFKEAYRLQFYNIFWQCYSNLTVGYMHFAGVFQKKLYLFSTLSLNSNSAKYFS